MSKLNKLVLDKIEALGIKEAAVYFNTSVGSIRAWKTHGRATVEAVERVMADAPDVGVAALPLAAGEVTQPVDAHESEHDEIWSKLNELLRRVTGLEKAMRMELGLPPLQAGSSSVVPPSLPVAMNQPVAPPVASPPPPQGQEPGAWLRPHSFVRRGL